MGVVGLLLLPSGDTAGQVGVEGRLVGVPGIRNAEDLNGTLLGLMGRPADAPAGVEAAQGLCILLFADPWSAEWTSIASWSADIAEGER